MRSMIVAVLALLVTLPAEAGRRKRTVAPPDPDAVAAHLLGQSLTASDAYEELEELCDTIGHRISGSPQLEAAIVWAAKEMRDDGLEVTTEEVMVPRWVRGAATGQLLVPYADEVAVLALGESVGTPEGGLEADILVVSSFDDLEAKKDLAKGRIVVFNRPFTTYGETVSYRYGAASAASGHGAVASLVRSVTPTSLYTPHTGNQRYKEDVTPIPTAAITIEDAERLHRLQTRGVTPRMKLVLDADGGQESLSHNVVGEIKGRELPDEIVVLGCHLDSWDVGQGAQDDGAGCVTVMAAGQQLAALPTAPKRTVRVVLYTNEENGLAGAKAYAAAHAEERFVAVVEDDTGSGAPLGFSVDTRRFVEGSTEERERDHDRAHAVIASLEPYHHWLSPVGAGGFKAGGSGADVGVLVDEDTVGFGLSHDMTGYWPIHHTEADTFEKVDPALVKRNVAAMSVFAWLLAEVAPFQSTP